MLCKFFLVPTLLATKANYQFASVILAEGFTELGIPYEGNMDYWFVPDLADHQIKAGSSSAKVHVYETAYLRAYPDAVNLLDKDKVNVLIDMDDKLITPAFTDLADHFDLVLRAHYTSALSYSDKVVSWPFALSKRILNAVEASLSEQVRSRVLRSYRVNLDVRKLTNDKFVPILAKKYEITQFESAEPTDAIKNDAHSYWYQTGRRHDDEYFVELNRSLIGLTFGGSFVPKPYPADTFTKLQNLSNRVLLKLIPGLRQQGKLEFIIQYDSWRFWETMVSNACAVFLNFEQCGLVLPVYPEPGVHYLAVDIHDIEGSANQILALTEAELKQISLAGREWAIKNYGPAAVAQRFIGILHDRKLIEK